ncbi:MAG TPA: DUF1570 domain-containing protein [Kofleriaceae bacterium]|nr:DUF1570 domain-containing protein [Kofleriaceae bacterium]
MRSIVAIAFLTACSSTAASDPKPPPPEVRITLPPGRRATFTNAQYTEHIAALRKRLAAKGLGKLSIRVEDPFVVVGDGTPAELERSASTVRWAADQLEANFFAKRPTKLLDIYLFTTEASYNAGVKTLTGEDPGTPFGFYSSTHGAMFMNIATGGGTLVHEIVHPYVEADFPDAPAWLNEGLGSLFEQSAERDGHIVGLTNWRLAGLQKSIRRGSVPSFRALTGLDRGKFYDDDSGTNYAQSRYLLYYLQEQKLLHDFYRAFRAAQTKDPTGYATLVATLGRDAQPDMKAFQRKWERYVIDLRFP